MPCAEILAGVTTRSYIRSDKSFSAKKAFKISLNKLGLDYLAPYLNVVIAMVGVCLSIFGGRMTLGTLASFLQFSRSFNQPISQLSQQLNSIIMAIAGAERIFALLDEEPVKDSELDFLAASV